jgi:hypothetical protein
MANVLTTLFICNFGRPISSLPVTTELSHKSLDNGHCSQQVTLSQPLKKKEIKVRGSCIIPAAS